MINDTLKDKYQREFETEVASEKYSSLKIALEYARKADLHNANTAISEAAEASEILGIHLADSVGKRIEQIVKSTIQDRLFQPIIGTLTECVIKL